MPIMKDSPRTGTKCYLHQMQRPLQLPFQHKIYHVCPVCQARVQELAKAGFRFKLRGNVVTLLVSPPEVEEKATVEAIQEAKKPARSKKKAVVR